MRRFNLLAASVVALTLPLAACEEDDDIDPEIATFRAPLAALNSDLRVVNGTATVEIVDDEVIRVTVNATGLDSMLHMQFIGAGDRCPSTAADVNTDGFIDIQEGMTAFGQILLTLDTTLTVRSDTAGFPVGSTINYSESAILVSVEGSLRGTPSNEFTANLPLNGNFDPEGLAVVILGDARTFPRTVATLPGFTESQTMPVACGVLARVTSN